MLIQFDNWTIGFIFGDIILEIVDIVVVVMGFEVELLELHLVEYERGFVCLLF